MKDPLDIDPELQKYQAKMDRPIPGESLTRDPEDPYPWEQPSEFTVRQEAIDYSFVTLTEENAYEGLVESAMSGATIMELTRLFLFKGFTEGKWNPDLMLILIEPVAYMIMGLLERAGVNDYVVMDDEDDEDIFGVQMPQEMTEGMATKKEVPEEVEEVMEQNESLLQQRTPSLMERR